MAAKETKMDVVIVASTEKKYNAAKAWLIAAGISFDKGAVYEWGSTNVKQKMIYTKMSRRERVLMKETVGFTDEIMYAFG